MLVFLCAVATAGSCDNGSILDPGTKKMVAQDIHRSTRCLNRAQFFARLSRWCFHNQAVLSDKNRTNGRCIDSAHVWAASTAGVMRFLSHTDDRYHRNKAAFINNSIGDGEDSYYTVVVTVNDRKEE